MHKPAIEKFRDLRGLKSILEAIHLWWARGGFTEWGTEISPAEGRKARLAGRSVGGDDFVFTLGAGNWEFTGDAETVEAAVDWWRGHNGPGPANHSVAYADGEGVWEISDGVHKVTFRLRQRTPI